MLWLVLPLFLLAQQAAVLHRMDHAFEPLASVWAAPDAPAGDDDTEPAHGETACAVCIAHGGALADSVHAGAHDAPAGVVLRPTGTFAAQRVSAPLAASARAPPLEPGTTG